MDNTTKSYSNIWKRERLYYSIAEWIPLPRPITQTQLIWFVVFLLLSFRLEGIPPFIFNGYIANNIAVPIGLTFFMTRKNFEDKQPYLFFLSYLYFKIRPKKTRRTQRYGLRKESSHVIQIIERGLNE